MKATIKHLHLENFGKHSEAVGGKTLDFELGHKTIISGCNRTGKSTIKRAIQYILGCKDENGKEISGIRPHDDNGVDIDGLITVAEMTICVDGMENTLKRTCFQEKNRQGKYTGKDNLQYFVDDVRKGTKKAYEEFVGKFFTESVCMSAREFLSKDTAGRRAMLEFFNNHDIESIIAENAEFEPLRAKLNANSTDDLKKTCREKIKTKTKERDAFPVKIEALNGQKEDIDVAELELLKNSLNEQISENKAKQENISKEFEEQQKTSDGILELKFELSDLERKANEENNRKKSELDDKISDIQVEIKKASNEVFICENSIKAEENILKSHQDGIEKERENYRNASSIEFNTNELICPMCKREYEQEKQQELRDSFDKNKAETLARITDNGNYFKTAIEQCKQHIEELKKEKKKWKDKIFELQKSLKSLTDELEKLPDSIDISNLPEVQEIQRKIAKKEQAMNNGNSASEIRENLQSQLEDLQSQLMEVNSKLAIAKKNVEIDEQIADLQKQKLAKSQEIADVERELDLLKSFERKKAELLESDVNSWFDYVQLKMSEIQQNGEPKDVCLITVNGESYDRNLNHGSKMLAEIDICRAFQRKYGVVLPIILDDTESLNPWDIPDIENQIIMLRWGESEELKIETEG